MSAAIIEIKPRTVTAGKFSKRQLRRACLFAEGSGNQQRVRPRVWFRSGEIRILDPTGNVERVIPFNDTNRKL